MAEKICVLRCQGGAAAADLFAYTGPDDCWLNFILFGGSKACEYGCLGLGHCTKVCPRGAISISEKRLPLIDNDLCDGCGKCVDECPRRVLELMPRSQLVFLACKSQGKGNGVTEICPPGCNACRICLEVCPHGGAIIMPENLPEMDYEKCNSCGICFNKCPPKSFIDRARARPYAIISLQCDGCGECLKVCQFKAIQGEPGMRHAVLKDNCIGCGRCFEVCPIRVITMAGALGYSNTA